LFEHASKIRLQTENFSPVIVEICRYLVELSTIFESSIEAGGWGLDVSYSQAKG
jgi:hypothetical protein